MLSLSVSYQGRDCKKLIQSIIHIPGISHIEKYNYGKHYQKNKDKSDKKNRILIYNIKKIDIFCTEESEEKIQKNILAFFKKNNTNIASINKISA